MVDRFIMKDPFELMSEKLKKRIEKPRYVKTISDAASALDMEVFSFSKQMERQGVEATLFVIVDKEDGSIVDASYICVGPTYLIGALEALVDNSLGYSMAQFSCIDSERLDKTMRDFNYVAAFPKEADPWINYVLEMSEAITAQCSHYIDMDETILLDEPATPVGQMNLEKVKNFTWDEASYELRLKVIDKVLKEDVRPYIQLDDGDIEIVSLEDEKLTIRYQGACVSCPSSIGGTLSAMNNILQKRVFEGIQVDVDMEALSL